MWPVIVSKKDPLPTADDFDGKPDKLQYLSEAPGEGG